MTMVIPWVRNANVSVSEEYAVRRQLESYEANRGEVEGLRRLDGTRPADELAAVVTRWIAGL
jgi:hypothetical protein